MVQLMIATQESRKNEYQDGIKFQSFLPSMLLQLAPSTDLLQPQRLTGTQN